MAETLDRRPSGLNDFSSCVHVTIVREGLVSVLQPLLPADVGALFVGMFCCSSALAFAMVGGWRRVEVAIRRDECNNSLRLMELFLLLLDNVDDDGCSWNEFAAVMQ